MPTDRLKALFDRGLFLGGIASFSVAVLGTVWPV
ncbi:hypothetical protein EV662_105161 [Rhodovulum marinum]|uniref:Uncharacterized protein n=1 Tax=Rhodovulum marinum TaxID=320662 RepID=A0A4R2Q155_9RHOB|nr:hypothetical protein EV662_105161 [Rhodovulum marinum]